MKRKQRISAIFIVIGFIMCMMNVFQTVSAAETTSITLHCYDEEQDMILSDMHWNIYLLGTLENEKFTWSDKFSQYQDTVLLENLSASELTDFASTLRVYTLNDKIEPTKSGISDTDGYVTFSGLPSGMYLLTAEKLKIDYRSWKAIPSIITVDASLSDNVVSVAKVRDATKDENETNYAVRKVWMKNKDEVQDIRQIRNPYITVEIYKNGELFETKDLSADNNWQYEWVDTTGAEWYVIEKDIPRYYTVSYRDNITEYVVVNTVQPQYRTSSFIWEEPDETTTTETLPPSMTDISTDTTPPDNSTTDSGTTTTPKTGDFIGTTTEIDHSTNQTETSTTNETDSSFTDISSSTGESGSDSSTSTTKTTVTTTTKSGSGSGSSSTTKTGNGSGSGSGNTGNSTPGGGSGGNTGGSGGTGSGNTQQITKLPQTGQLWWPVPVLACGGILMMSIGMKLGKKED